MVEIDNPWVIAVGTGVILVFLQLILSHYFQSVREWIARNTWVQTGLISLIVASAVGLVMSERPDTESRIALVAAELAKNHALALKGADGVDGNDGVNGKDGVAGKDGLDGKEAPEPDIVLIAEELVRNHAPALKGEDGVDGNDGVNGKDGVVGKDGMAGKDGLDGKDAPEPDIVLIAEGLVRNHATALKGEDGVDGFAPDGAVVAFLNSCDKYENWDPYDKAAGRVIVGVGPIDPPRVVRSGGGRSFGIMPPYIALYFCKYEGT